jgi:hypothetical protein
MKEKRKKALTPILRRGETEARRLCKVLVGERYPEAVTRFGRSQGRAPRPQQTGGGGVLDSDVRLPSVLC